MSHLAWSPGLSPRGTMSAAFPTNPTAHWSSGTPLGSFPTNQRLPAPYPNRELQTRSRLDGTGLYRVPIHGITVCQCLEYALRRSPSVHLLSQRHIGVQTTPIGM
ncbi:hypothetical protein BD309DRAFT_973271 [Dichomitus squalens]|nr:hypothetical protein BD309DRAFT_973271 [Dichomitus squalens]